MSLPAVRRGGRLLRVCDRDWEDPLDASFSMIGGGRWNEPGSFPVLYLNADEATARANVRRRFLGMPYGPEDLANGPDLASVDVARGTYADCESTAGLAAHGLPASYRVDEDGNEVGWGRCRPIGRTAFDRRLAGVACRSAAATGESGLREIAHFSRTRDVPPALRSRVPFDDWFWAPPGHGGA